MKKSKVGDLCTHISGKNMWYEYGELTPGIFVRKIKTNDIYAVVGYETISFMIGEKSPKWITMVDVMGVNCVADIYSKKISDNKNNYNRYEPLIIGNVTELQFRMIMWFKILSIESGLNKK